MIQILFEQIKNLEVLCLSIITFEETVQNMISFLFLRLTKEFFLEENVDNGCCQKSKERWGEYNEESDFPF